MKAAVRQGLILGAGVLFSVNASAVLMTVEAVGTVYSSYDATGSFSGTAGAGSFNGREVTATWTFDTDYMPSDYFAGNSSYAQYDNGYDAEFTNQNWITSSVTLGGAGSALTEAPNDDFDLNQERDYLYMHDDDVYGRDVYQVYSYSYDRNYSPYGYEYELSYAYFYDYLDDILDGLDPSQEFVWEDNDASDYGRGYFSFYDNDPYLSVWGNYSIDTFRVTAAATGPVNAVPEPGTLALLALGLAGLGMARRKQA